MDKLDRSAEAILTYMKELFEEYLEELNEIEGNEYGYGEKAAYVECLEIMQEWEGAASIGLDYNIEERFPITY